MPRKREPMINPRRPGDPASLGEFHILGRLGSGGFGTVFVGSRRQWTNELAAVKVVHAQLAEDRTFRDRFTREIIAIGRVQSNYVPRLMGEDAGADEPWLATELIRGPSLHQVIWHCGPLPEDAVWHLGLGIVRALEAIHKEGIAHRDLKPGNVLITPEGPRVIDFSLVHLAELGHGSSSRVYMGSHEYAPLEQLWGLKYAGKQADIFAFGGTLLCAATGHPPFADRMEAQQANVNLADLPRALYPVVAPCLNKAEDDRPSLAELKATFESRAGGEGGSFRASLPRDVISLIGAWRSDLNDLVRPRDGSRSEMARAWEELAPEVPAKSTGQHRQARQAEWLPEGSRRPSNDGMTVIKPDTVTPVQVSPDERYVRWRKQFRDWLRAPVTVADGMAAVASLDGTVAFFTADTGELLWAASLGTPVTYSVALPPAGNGVGRTAYAGDAHGSMHVLDVVAREHRPVFQAIGAIEGPPVVAAGHVYALSADGCVYQIDARTSSYQMMLELGEPALGALMVADGVLFAAGAGGAVHAIDINDRQRRWRLDTGGLVHAAPVAADGWLYVGGTDGLLWSVDIDDHRRRGAVDIGVPLHTAPQCADGRLFVGGSDGVVRAFDVSGGHAGHPEELWPRPPKVGDEVSGLAVADDRVYAAADGMLVELDVDTGRPGLRLKVGNSVTAAPVAAGNFVYVAGLDGVVSCLSM